jgi:hypothetical protein
MPKIVEKLGQKFLGIKIVGEKNFPHHCLNCYNENLPNANLFWTFPNFLDCFTVFRAIAKNG